jgi:hypothetical protein
MIPSPPEPPPPMRSARLLATALVLAPAAAGAQLLSAGLGGGRGVGRRVGPDSGATMPHAEAWAQLGVPVFPVSLRGDLLVTSRGTAGGPVAASISAVASLPVPVVTPYATVGWGTYGIGGDRKIRGWSAGAGVRAKLPGVPGIFAEVRRHQRLGRDLATVGVVF